MSANDGENESGFRSMRTADAEKLVDLASAMALGEKMAREAFEKERANLQAAADDEKTKSKRNYAKSLLAHTDDQLAEELSHRVPGSVNHEVIKFEMQRRLLIAQKEAAEAAMRSALASERYTRATWWLLFFTALGAVGGLVWR